ncbi:MAG: hypothetical protein JW861_01675 [Bacteroidales bacterium]|nr:hypothetical protein [Bacteroidales bacterium]
MKTLEDIIKGNLHRFDDQEPVKGHRKRFLKKLSRRNRKILSVRIQEIPLALKVAASIVLVAGLATLYLTRPLAGIKQLLSQRLSTMELPAEIRDMMEYYNIISDQQVQEIDQLAASPEEAGKIKQLALQELETLDQYTDELKRQYQLNADERTLAALINSQRKRAEIMERIINQIN